MLGSCPSFPSTAIFNTRIDDRIKFPPHASSDAWITAIGTTRALHADWGTDEDNASATHYGIPVNFLSASAPETDWPSITFATRQRARRKRLRGGQRQRRLRHRAQLHHAGAERLALSVPARHVVKIEGYDCRDARQGCDRHVLIVETGACRLWENYSVSRTKVAGSGARIPPAAWDLASNAMRSDTGRRPRPAGPAHRAAARARERGVGGRDSHALRVTFRDSVLTNTHVWPARHGAGGSSGSIPFGAACCACAPTSRSVLVDAAGPGHRDRDAALRMYVADIGSDLYVQGDPSVHWSGSTISQIQALRMSNFEFRGPRGHHARFALQRELVPGQLVTGPHGFSAASSGGRAHVGPRALQHLARDAPLAHAGVQQRTERRLLAEAMPATSAGRTSAMLA
jgi:hypothetical protein